MLCQATVSNFKCFKGSITLDLQATNITENTDSVIVDVDGEKFLPISVIYGPNGAGKSTVLLAVYSLACKIMRPICAVGCDNKECLKRIDNFEVAPYKFSEETKDLPTTYQLFFRTQEYEYEFNISIFGSKIIEESLYRKRLLGKKYTLLFERNGKRTKLFGSFRNYNCDDISDYISLISYLGITHRRNACIKDIVDWFENSFTYIDFGNPLRDSRITIIASEFTKNRFIEMLHEMDINISDYRVEEDEDGDIKEVYTEHKVGDSYYELDLKEESSGTIKLFVVLFHIIKAIYNGGTLMIDELDAKLHPRLLEYIINLFNDPKINTKKSQLIFTSHDLTTMNSDNFRRDEIWFVAKGVDQSSYLYSLVEIKNGDGTSVRKDARFSKSYLEGKYGADPYFKKIINWEET